MRRAWQAGILVLILAGLTNLFGAIAESFQSGTFGFETSRVDGSRTHLRVLSITPGSPADRAGIRAGDTIVFAPTPSNVEVMRTTAPGDTIAILDGSRTIQLRAVLDKTPPSFALLTSFCFAKIAFAAMALLIIWRRPDDVAARSLSLFLAAFSFGMVYDLVVFPAMWIRILSAFMVPTAFFAATVALLSFACRFPSLPQRGMRSALAKAIPAISIVGIILVETPLILLLLSGRDVSTALRYLDAPPILFQGGLLLVIFAALVNAYVTSAPEERPRMRWLVGTLIVGLSGVFVIVAAAAAGVDVSNDTIQYFAFTMLVIPFGLAYVILRHRVLDIAFVVNRALVYTGVSIVVVGAFTIFEWIIGHFVETNSRASTMLQLGGALVLGFSVRYIHNRVDRYVDDVFFRERHLAEAAVRRFAHEAPLITDAGDLVVKTTEVAQRNMRLSACAFYTRRDNEFIPLHSTFTQNADVGENDYAVLEMRTWHSPVSLHDTHSLLAGEIALPMIVRGELTGFLLCGDKSNHEAFAPDERDALAQLARDAGIALDSLRVREIEREFHRLGLQAPDATGGGALAL